MKITQINTSKSGYFKAEINGQEVGMMSYTWADPHRINIVHTGVEKEYMGKGIAREMVMEGVKYARAHNLKITPMCSYVRHVFEKDPSLSDVQG